MLGMAVFTLVTLVLGGVLAAVCVQRYSAARDRVRAEVEEELNAKLRDDQRLADAVADQLRTDAPVDQIVAACQRDRAALLPADRPREHPWNWGPDELARWQRGEVAARARAAQRRCLLSLVLLGSGLVILTVAVNAAVYDRQYARPRTGAVPPSPRPAPAPSPTKGATP